jgi:hypothetical protein
MIFLPPRYHLLVKAKMQRDATILDIRFVFHSPSPQQLSCKQLSWQVETARGCGCGLSLIGALASKCFSFLTFFFAMTRCGVQDRLLARAALR